MRFIGAFLIWAVAVGSLEAGPVQAGFLFDYHPLTLADGNRTEILGPFFFNQNQDTEFQWGMPPLCSRTKDASADLDNYDFLYPVLTYDRFGSEHRLQLFQLIAFAGGANQRDNEERRFTLFPFYFQQRSPEPDLNYTAVMPFGGILKKRLFRDEIQFVLFPVYGQSRKRDVVTDNYFFPIVHLRKGNGLAGWQVWPLMGREHKEVTFKTNINDELEVAGGHDKTFVLWPFYFDSTTGVGTTNLAEELSFLPFYSQLRSPARDSTTIIWPFFSHVDDRAQRYREWELPWPLVIFARGEGKTADRIWPFFSNVHGPNKDSAFYLWPIYKYNRLRSDPLDRERTRLLLYLYSDVNQKNTATGRSLRRLDLWPLFTYQRDYNGDNRLQLLAPIEPILPGNQGIERNWSPLWSIWRSEAKGDGTATSQSFLWNLYRHENTPSAEKCSLLFGLFQYQSNAEGWRYRFCHLPVLWKKKNSPPPAQSVSSPIFQNVPVDLVNNASVAGSVLMEAGGQNAAP